MMEIPESNTIAQQLNQTIQGKTILNVTANHSPHKFTWYFGDPSTYHDLLTGTKIGRSLAVAGNVEIQAGERRILLQDGVNLRYLPAGEEAPQKHQLFIEFDDFSRLTATVQMYGGISAFRDGENDNPYYLVGKEKPSPLSDGFDESYFVSLCGCSGFEKLSAKAYLATEQRIPGLGNGVLQDILWNARIHPKRKMGELSDSELAGLYRAVKDTLMEMALKGGRNTERDLYGCFGGYRSVLSKNTVGQPCPECGTPIQKEAYLGGSIYYCGQCQKYEKPVKLKGAK
jgi:formamidopyrimidine-DNA glycosylase